MMLQPAVSRFVDRTDRRESWGGFADATVRDDVDFALALEMALRL